MSWIAQTILQLVLLPIIILGQNVQGAAADKRAEATYEDADAVLHTALQIQQHLEAQDAGIEKSLALSARRANADFFLRASSQVKSRRAATRAKVKNNRISAPPTLDTANSVERGHTQTAGPPTRAAAVGSAGPAVNCAQVFNIGAEKLLVILVVALVVLGPEGLPEGMRRFGQIMAQRRNLASGFQDELHAALNEPLEQMRSSVDTVRNPLTEGEEPAGEATTDTHHGTGP